MTNDTALLIIDVQKGLLEDQDYPHYDGEGLVKRLTGVIERARAADVPVIFVQHCGSEGDSIHPSEPGWALDPRLGDRPTDPHIEKSHPDSFQDTNLQSELEARGIHNLIIGGMETEMCVDTTTRRAYSLGYKVTLIGDGHTTAQYGELSVPQIIAHHNLALGMGFAKVKPAAEIEFEQEKQESKSRGLPPVMMI
jgi:nicotinamidase-related amidase